MSLFRRLTVLAGAAEAARRYARANPDKAGNVLDKAAQFVDKQTKGKYTNQISGATRKAKDAAGIPQPGFGYGAPGTTPPAPGRPAAGGPTQDNGHRPGDQPQAGQGGGQQPPAFPPPNPGDPRGA